jgi:uncharacterized repeat protein (TIGR02543 family)
MNDDAVCTVEFDALGGSSVPSQTVAVGALLTRPADPTYPGFVFGGWFTDPPAYQSEWNFAADAPGTDMDLFAKWTAATVYQLRAAGPASGLVCYDRGYVEDGWRYLEAGPVDLGPVVWGPENLQPATPSLAEGQGAVDTPLIVEALTAAAFAGDFAAKLCADYAYGGYDDWSLPSRDDLRAMYRNLRDFDAGGFATDGDAWYWTSTNISAIQAWAINFYGGYETTQSKHYDYRVRPVRRF